MIKRIAIVPTNPKTSLIIRVQRSKLKNKKLCIIWIIMMHCGIVLDFTLPKSAIILPNQAMLPDSEIGLNCLILICEGTILTL